MSEVQNIFTSSATQPRHISSVECQSRRCPPTTEASLLGHSYILKTEHVLSNIFVKRSLLYCVAQLFLMKMQSAFITAACKCHGLDEYYIRSIDVRETYLQPLGKMMKHRGKLWHREGMVRYCELAFHKPLLLLFNPYTVFTIVFSSSLILSMKSLLVASS